MDGILAVTLHQNIFNFRLASPKLRSWRRLQRRITSRSNILRDVIIRTTFDRPNQRHIITILRTSDDRSHRRCDDRRHGQHDACVTRPRAIPLPLQSLRFGARIPLHEVRRSIYRSEQHVIVDQWYETGSWFVRSYKPANVIRILVRACSGYLWRLSLHELCRRNASACPARVQCSGEGSECPYPSVPATTSPWILAINAKPAVLEEALKWHFNIL